MLLRTPKRLDFRPSTDPQAACRLMTGYAWQDCPRHGRGSADVIRLGADWRKRTHVCGAQLCFYLTESAKSNAAGNFASLDLGWLLDRASHVRTDVALPVGIKYALERARKTGSRIGNPRLAAERLRQRGAK